METQQTTHTPITTQHGRYAIAQRVVKRIESADRETFLLGALASVGVSLTLRFLGRTHDALFVGQWVPTLLLAGLYSDSQKRLLEEGSRTEVAQQASKSLH
jgi:hypothetical protein